MVFCIYLSKYSKFQKIVQVKKVGDLTEIHLLVNMHIRSNLTDDLDLDICCQGHPPE